MKMCEEASPKKELAGNRSRGNCVTYMTVTH